jgi:tRNA threonylcarbamoyladenosine biosynthesis protein TsaB
MLLLVTDTSGRNGSIALARAEDPQDEVQIIESVPLAGGTFSAQLVPQIAALLTKHGFGKIDIGGFVVVSGPGSFTGLRVGLAAIKGLAEILEKPIVPVSLLEAVALASDRRGTIIAALDAGRGEAYAGEYELSDNGTRLINEYLVAKNELLANKNGIVLSTTDDALIEMARLASVPVIALDAITVESIARVGWKKLRAGETISPDLLDANYIRRTIAEIYPKPAS